MNNMEVLQTRVRALQHKLSLAILDAYDEWKPYKR